MRRFAMLLGAATLIATTASAQPNFNANPSFGTINLTAGFANDPRVIAVTAGGRLSAQSIDSSCRGSVANAPDVRLNYTAGGELPLIISVDSNADTTLAVNGPDGSWYCDDDTNGVNPVVRFNSPQSGRYDIYVGHYQEGSRIPARLYISEVTSAGAQ
jgi:hypothetical protein